MVRLMMRDDHLLSFGTITTGGERLLDVDRSGLLLALLLDGGELVLVELVVVVAAAGLVVVALLIGHFGRLTRLLRFDF